MPWLEDLKFPRGYQMGTHIADLNSVNTIKKIGGSKEQKRHLENLGFVPGAVIVVVSKTNGNVIVNVKEVRIAISEELARKIMV